MATVRATGTQEFIQYDGTNSGDIVTFVEQFYATVTITSEGGGTLVIFNGIEDHYTINETEWFNGSASISDTDFQANYIVKE